MSMSRREFLHVLAAAASGLALDSKSVLAGNLPSGYYDMPHAGNVSFLYFTDPEHALRKHARPPQVFLAPPRGGGLGSAQPWGRSEVG